MDVALMQFVAEAQAAAPAKGAGKPAASQGKDGGEFGAMFAGLVAAGQPQSGEAKKPDAETQAAGEPAPGLAPGMWNVAALLAQLPLTAAAGQPALSQAAQDTTGAITPLTAAAGQTAQATQTLPQPQFTAPATSGAGQQTLPEATTQPAVQTATTQTPMPPQQAPAVNASQPQPARPEMQVMPATTPAATPAPAPTTEAQAAPVPAAAAPAPTTEAQAAPVPAATAIPAPAEQPAAAATGQETATQQQVKPTVISQAAITAAIAGGQRQPEKPAAAQAPVTAVETEAQPRIASPAAATMTVAAGGETQAAGDDSSSFTAEIFPPAAQNAAPPPETATANQMFAAFVDQAAGRTNAAESTFAAAGNETAAPAQDPHNVAGQIVDHASLITRAENSEMVIKLNPEHLGELTLKIVVDSGAVSATFHTSNSEVRAAIEASLPQLRQDMANQGLKVDNVGVYTSLDHFFANDQRHAPQQQMPQTARRTGGDEAFADTVATVAAIGAQTAGGGTGIDYRI
jgi:flagellar hook-length control protein FliK